MSKSQTSIKFVTPEIVRDKDYDAVIVGAGVAGAIVAKQLSQQGKTVLILEAGTGQALTLEGFQSHVETFYGAVEKNSNSPYPRNPNALSPTDDVLRFPEADDPRHYFKEEGPLPLSGSYTRVLGGTTMHWEGKTIRMIPDDFKLRTNYGQGLDWPISYEDLQPYYRQAEYELGVSGNTEEQANLGVPFIPGYVLPMKELPPSYLDQKVSEGLGDATVDLYGETFSLGLSTFPQARNSIPNPDYKRPGFKPNELRPHNFVPKGVASVNPVEYGERCQGNANCVPICPVQAKYDARKTLNTIAFPERVHLLPKAVAFKVEVGENGRVTGIHFKHYQDKDSPNHTDGIATGTLFVLAANAVENAKLMLISGLPSSSGFMGWYLMDHPYLLARGLMPDVTGTLRGPQVTSGISHFRKGKFRHNQSVFAMSIHNDGWGWSGTDPTKVVRYAVDQNIYGNQLRQELISKISRQLLLDFMCELPAESSNRVTIDDQYKDQLGIPRPVIHFNIPNYTKNAIVFARELSRTIFERLGVKDHTNYDEQPQDPAYFFYEGNGYWTRGGNHFAGTHVMGTNKSDSVVDQNLRSWDHENLYMVGAGSMPSIGSSNTTLTLAALSFKASEQMLKDLKNLEI
ncbi:GMC family oxidoreductase [Moorena sp. SIO4G3]|uniref:GMC family oxidoreductase n=1 Tax=Moorena sp. SIO4G3 TaxID=2607821 RepID=UPI001429F1FD|nr:GMC family oxidoreductase [Moorena sp. SIO4G3]NEO74872.1 GMC family oxidoreductase [Moorena sp. SIO4G3]